MHIVGAFVMFFVVFVALYCSMKVFSDLPKNERMQNFIAVSPSLAGVSAFLTMEFLLPAARNPFALLTVNVFPTLMVAITLVLLMRVKLVRDAAD
ncbi:hypothetical protein N781_15610 [Pontibacillus halophilus JSM 076056 = DSM 19796]|uniref:Uncharacterized protein n=1 Tax=Pontibacillus halophilus JSM 076056 = DSM 19796 TaxID=1385510 RepID=A0A0A5GHQ9_9BACI|nr:hypothetical protein [Pontibacillus halophilus]KGX92801.1 hypothetical protein N781_15610 [Pontibacillus halophilus JSM 076056 = DSM 19796]